MIDVEDLSVSFGDTQVFESVSTEIHEGRFLGLVGPNGAGKSTLLRTLSGAVAPDSGSVKVDGVDVEERTSREHSRLVSVVPQDTSLAFSFEVRHFVEMGRTPYRSRFAPPDEVDRAHVDRALDRTETAQFESRSVDELSGGERQRVVLARALAQDTPVILLDEPTASLDVNHQVEILSLVADLAASGKTVVAAIHDLDLAARFCDELLLLAGGSCIDRGPPAEVLSAETIESAFGARSVVSSNPVTGTPSVTTLPAHSSETEVPERIHVVGSGRIASDVLARLNGTDSTVSLGPVPRGDAAAETASRLNIDCLAVDPLSELGADARRRLQSIVADADAGVLVTGGPLDSSEFVWETMYDVPAVVVDDATGDTETTTPTARSLERLRETAPVVDVATLLAGLATVERRPPDPPALDLPQKE